MSKRKRLRYILSLMLAAMLCLISCKADGYNHCPVYPIAGPQVALELGRAGYDDYPHTWEWIGRINKLRQELELCR